MVPSVLIVAAIALVGAAVAVAVTMKVVIDWFRARARVKHAYQGSIAFTLAVLLNGHRYVQLSGVFKDPPPAGTRIIQGIYDADDGRMIEARLLEPNTAVTDQGIIGNHQHGDGLVIYT